MTHNLRDISKAFSQEADEIESCFHQCTYMTPIAVYKVAYMPAIEGCLTALWDSWGRFIRSVILTSAAGSTVGGSGRVYSPAQVRSASAALRTLKTDSYSRGNRIRIMGGEPAWSASESLLDICNSLSFSASHPLHAAVTANNIALPFGNFVPNPIQEIRDVRNFCAHKGDATYLRMKSHFAGGTKDAHTHMCTTGTGGIANFSHWVDCLKVISEAATY